MSSPLNSVESNVGLISTVLALWREKKFQRRQKRREHSSLPEMLESADEIMNYLNGEGKMRMCWSTDEMLDWLQAVIANISSLRSTESPDDGKSI